MDNFLKTTKYKASGGKEYFLEIVNKDDILWLAFDKDILDLCTGLEKQTFIYQNGIIGKVVRIESKDNSTFDVGVQFITREEKNLTNIYPKIYFLTKNLNSHI